MIKVQKLLLVLLVLVVLATITLSAQTQAATGPIKVYKDGKAISFTKAPYYKKKQLYVEFDSVYKKLGYKITTNKNTITYTKKGYKNKMYIGKNMIYVNGKKKSLALPVQKINNKVYVPLTIVPLTTDKVIRWNKNKTAIYIEVKNPIIETKFDIKSVSMVKGTSENIDVYSPQTILRDNEVTWKSTNTNVVKVDDNGVIQAVNKGIATIVITILNTTSSYKIPVTVTPKKVVSINTLNSISLIKGEKQKLTYTIAPADAEDIQINWSSTDNSIVSVNQYGEIEAIKKGTAIIRAEVKGSEQIFALTTVTVSPGQVTAITLPTEINLTVGDNFEVPYTVTPEDAVDYKLWWEEFSDYTGVLEINEKGVITAKKPGTVEIGAVLQSNHLISSKTKVTVKEKVVTLEDVKKEGSISLFQTYLKQNYSTLVTPLDDWKPIPEVTKENNNIFIKIDWSTSQPYALKYPDPEEEIVTYGKVLTTQDRIETKQLLRTYMKQISADTFYAFPGHYVKGQFYKSGYKYPNLRVGYWSIDFLTWNNFNGTGTDSILRWDPQLDDYNFVLDQEITSLSLIHPTDGKVYGKNSSIPPIQIKKGETFKIQLSVEPQQDISQLSYKELGWDVSSDFRRVSIDDYGNVLGRNVGDDYIFIYFGKLLPSFYIPVKIVE